MLFLALLVSRNRTLATLRGITQALRGGCRAPSPALGTEEDPTKSRARGTPGAHVLTEETHVEPGQQGAGRLWSGH